MRLPRGARRGLDPMRGWTSAEQAEIWAFPPSSLRFPFPRSRFEGLLQSPKGKDVKEKAVLLWHSPICIWWPKCEKSQTTKLEVSESAETHEMSKPNSQGWWGYFQANFKVRLVQSTSSPLASAQLLWIMGGLRDRSTVDGAAGQQRPDSPLALCPAMSTSPPCWISGVMSPRRCGTWCWK